MDCAESLRVQAYFDGEVDAGAAAEIERHLATCEQCRALLDDLTQLRSAVRAQGARIVMPAPLRARILQALDDDVPRPSRPSRPSRPFWLGVFSGVGGTALAAAVAFLVLAPLLNNGLVNQLVADHTRSLTSAHLIDVVSTDQHTVKPWFAGRTDVSPVVADFASQGYRLLGGRIDDVADHKAAVMVFQHGKHLINVFSWASSARPLPRDTTRNGYHLAFWQVGNLSYCAVSDTGWVELTGLVALLQQQGARELSP